MTAVLFETIDGPAISQWPSSVPLPRGWVLTPVTWSTHRGLTLFRDTSRDSH